MRDQKHPGEFRRELLPRHQRKKETRTKTGVRIRKGKKITHGRHKKKPTRDKQRTGRRSRGHKDIGKCGNRRRSEQQQRKFHTERIEQNRRTSLCNNPKHRRKLRRKAHIIQRKQLPDPETTSAGKIHNRRAAATDAQHTEFIHREETSPKTSTNVGHPRSRALRPARPHGEMYPRTRRTRVRIWS